MSDDRLAGMAGSGTERVAVAGAKASERRYLRRGAAAWRLAHAAAANHAAWFAANATASGGEVRQTHGVTWTAAPNEIILAFPRLEAATAGTALDDIVAECYERKPKQASCWSLSPTRPVELGVLLAARGFEWGWRPHWMALDLRAMGAATGASGPEAPTGVEISVDDVADWEVQDLPYYDNRNAPILQTLSRATPRRMWHFAARQDGAVVGHCVLYMTEGAQGVGGIYNVGVVPAARHRGIGSAVSLAACRFAAALGCTYATLNSAADGLYERLGFVCCGYGQTWWLYEQTMAGSPPSRAQIAFVEALGRSDVAGLDAMRAGSRPDDLDAPLPNGMTPMALAVAMRKPSSVRWLATHGATLDVLDAWDLGWKGEARQLLRRRPELANRRRGARQITPLHEAVWRNDAALAKLLLTASPDLEIHDAAYRSTSLGWARHFQRTEIIALIEAHEKKD
jgi:GNAT superfamily N-acetyltransferase